VASGHAIADAAEKVAGELFPEGAEVTAHIEPAGIADERLDDKVHAQQSGEATEA
jgi:divalent metal cation (Fe/Co/Zn/Cd) transporter